MKKTLCLIVVLAMVSALCLVACDGMNQDTPQVETVEKAGQQTIEDTSILSEEGEERGDEDVVKDSLHSHAFGAWDIIREATCLEEGLKVRVCACGEKEEERIAPLGHDIIYHEAKESSINESGWEAYITCSRCDYTTYKAIPALMPSVGLSFSLQSDDTYQVDGIGECTDKNILIPPTYEEKRVTSIAEGAFSECDSLVSITIPAGVMTIGADAFSDCSSLIEIVIPEGVTTIGDRAFCNCSRLSVVAMPSTLTMISDNLFWGCSNLKSVNIPSSVTSIGDNAFSGCSCLTSISIPLAVTCIGEGVFSGCPSLEDVTIPFVGAVADKSPEDTEQFPFGYLFGITEYDGSTAVEQRYYASSTSSRTSTVYYIPSSLRSVTILGGNILFGAFEGCSMLSSITLHENLKNIGNCAFRNCIGLTSITIPASVITIERLAFFGCKRLVEVYNKSSLDITNDAANGYVGYYSKNIYTQEGESHLSVDSNGYLLYKDESIVSLIKYIGSGSELSIPSDITEINKYAFYGYTELEAITIPVSLKCIGENAFCDSSRLTTIHYQGDIAHWCDITGLDGLMSYGSNNKNLYIDNHSIESELSIPKEVTAIPDSAFRGTDLISVLIPDTVTSIGEGAFCFCSSLTSVSIPKSITSIPDRAFCYCESLTSITVPESVTSIGESAFNSCEKLETIILPRSLKSLGRYAFSLCPALTSVYFKGSISDWCSVSGLEGLMRDGGYNYGSLSLYIGGSKISGALTIPSGTTLISEYAFFYCPITSVSIPSTVKYIARGAFEGCNGLTSVTIPNGVESVDGFYGCDNLKSVTIPVSVTGLGNTAFGFCPLSSITYRGSKKQWDDIFKGSGWDYRTGKYTIHCTNGDIAKK